MKWIFIHIALSFIFISTIKCQTVDSIKVEQAGDFIKIRYKILNSTPDQVYRVKVLCSINGGMNTEIRSISGDVGDMVAGGKPEYWVVWDVLKDVEELKSAEFIVRAELVKDNSTVAAKVPKSKGPPTHKFHLMPSLQLPGPGYGLRFGYMGKVGFSLQYIMTSGKKILVRGSNYDGPNPRLDRFSIDFTGRIINKKTFQTHLLIGSTVGEWISHYPDDPTDWNLHITGGVDAGFGFYLHRIAFFVTGSRYFPSMTEEDDVITDTKHTFLTFDVGFRF
jgi:hypothetical protein